MPRTCSKGKNESGKNIYLAVMLVKKLVLRVLHHKEKVVKCKKASHRRRVSPFPTAQQKQS